MVTISIKVAMNKVLSSENPEKIVMEIVNFHFTRYPPKHFFQLISLRSSASKQSYLNKNAFLNIILKFKNLNLYFALH